MRLIFVHAYIFPLIEYMIILWGVAKKKLIKRIDNIVKNSARFVLGVKKRDSVRLYICKKLMWLMPKELLIYKTLILFFKILKSDGIESFKGSFSKSKDRHQHNTRSTIHVTNSNPLNTQNNSTYFSFESNAVRYWNVLPIKLRLIHDIQQFKLELKTHLLCQQSDRLLT